MGMAQVRHRRPPFKRVTSRWTVSLRPHNLGLRSGWGATSVTLDDVATALDRLTSIDEDDEARVRACFSNLLIGIQRQHITVESAERRISEMIDSFAKASRQDYGALLDAQLEALRLFGEEDHYVRPGPLSDHLDRPALTIQINEDGLLGEFWLGRRTRGGEIAAAFLNGQCQGRVGAPGRPLWLTPFRDQVWDICDEAKLPNRPPDRRAILARKLVSLLGLSTAGPGDDVLAFVTKGPIGELGFRHPSLAKDFAPAGSTALEARGHRRFRPWPAPLVAETYGRTYALDKGERAAARPLSPHGALEAVRPSMPMDDFAECVFVGTLNDADFDDPDGEFLEAIGARQTTPEIIRRLAEHVSP